MTSDVWGRTVSYTAANPPSPRLRRAGMPAEIAQGATHLYFAYDSEHQRVAMSAPAGDTIYLSDAGSGVFFEKFEGASLTIWNEYLIADGRMVGEHFTRSDETTDTRYFVLDHLGSVAIVMDETGAVEERLSYDAWGKRRYPSGTDDSANAITSQTTRGFTGHEMIDGVTLINMNARIYDPLLGRFLSADTQTQSLFNLQTLNRYSYTGNNPLSFTDPNGHGFFNIFKTIVAIAVAIFFQQWEFAIAVFGEFGSALIGGFLAGLISGGDLQGGLIGALQAGLFYGVGFLKGKIWGIHTAAETTAEEIVGSAVMHGMVGGLVSEIQGGEFGSGFLAGGFSDLAGNIDLGSVPANTALAAFTGGIASELGGGKFENGAITGAFGYLFNQFLHREFMYDANRERYGSLIYLPGQGVTFLDSEMAYYVRLWIELAEEEGIHLEFTSGYRSPAEQAALLSDPSAVTPATNSLHSAGLAVDIKWSKLTSYQQAMVIDLAAISGLSWGGNWNAPDPVHFYFDPAQFGMSIARSQLITNFSSSVQSMTAVAPQMLKIHAYCTGKNKC